MNSSYLNYGIEDWPAAIFDYAGSATRDAAVNVSVQSKRRIKQPLARHDIANLKWRPVLLADMVKNGSLTTAELDQVFESNYPLIFRTLTCDYAGLAPLIESRLHADPESMARLLCYLQIEEKVPFNPVALYQSALGEDPNYTLHTMLNPDDAAFKREQFAAESETLRHTSPGWAFFYLRCHPEITVVPHDLVDVIKVSEEYCYLTARLLASRYASTADSAALLQYVKSPRWVYHLLRDGLAVDMEKRLDQLYDHPAWLVQYMVKAKVDQHQREEMFITSMKRLVESDPANVVEQDFNLWFLSQSSAAILAAHDQRERAA